MYESIEQRTKIPCLLRMARIEGGDREKVVALLKVHLVALDAFLHLKHQLTEQEVTFVAENVFDEFGGSLTMADVNIVFRNIKAGRYGHLYERLSAPDICLWIAEYASDKMGAAEAYTQRKIYAHFGQPEQRQRTGHEPAADDEAYAEHVASEMRRIIENKTKPLFPES